MRRSGLSRGRRAGMREQQVEGKLGVVRVRHQPVLALTEVAVAAMVVVVVVEVEVMVVVAVVVGFGVGRRRRRAARLRIVPEDERILQPEVVGSHAELRGEQPGEMARRSTRGERGHGGAR